MVVRDVPRIFQCPLDGDVWFLTDYANTSAVYRMLGMLDMIFDMINPRSEGDVHCEFMGVVFRISYPGG